MKQPHLQAGALLAACAAGRGVIVIVEGEHREDDEYFYSRWFGTLGPRISFFAQNGWERVVVAVAELRKKLPHHPVFGIIDRDFGDEALIVAQRQQVPTDGVHRLPRYTLENYLLEPAGWHAVADILTRGNPPAGWASMPEVADQIDVAYRECLVLAAWNRTVHDEHHRQPGEGLRYREHPAALDRIDPAAELAAWGLGRGAPRALDAVFVEHEARLRAAGMPQWSVEVTGKAVLRVLLRRLQLATSQIPFEILCSLYLEQHPEPPQDLQQIVASILAAAGT